MTDTTVSKPTMKKVFYELNMLADIEECEPYEEDSGLRIDDDGNFYFEDPLLKHFFNVIMEKKWSQLKDIPQTWITSFLKSLKSYHKPFRRFIRNRFYEAAHKGAFSENILDLLDYAEIPYAIRFVVRIESDDAIFRWILGCYRGKYRRTNTVRNMSRNTAPSACRSVV